MRKNEPVAPAYMPMSGIRLDNRVSDIEKREEWYRNNIDNIYYQLYKHILWISELETRSGGNSGGVFGEPENKIMYSRLCTADELLSDDLQRFREPLHIPLYDYCKTEYSRKEWEWEVICHILDRLGMLEKGKKGLGFAVGIEPLPAYFVSRGCIITATDLGIENDTEGLWICTNQNALGSAENLNKFGICKMEAVGKELIYRDVNMNEIPEDLCREEFDFCWSSCAIEHVGGLEKSKAFLKNMLAVLKPGGVGIHTTEYNLSSEIATVEDGYSVIFRKSDIKEIYEWALENGYEMYVDFHHGDSEMDLRMCKYRQSANDFEDYLLTCNIDGFDSTSFVIIIRKEEK